MTVAFFHTNTSHDSALTYGQRIANQSCAVNYYEVVSVDDASFRVNPSLVLDKATHVLYAVSGLDTDFTSFVFLAGYCLGKAIPLIVLELEGKSPMPDYCRSLGTFLAPETFDSFFASEQNRFLSEDKKNKARTALLERGISCFEENFMLIVSSGDAEAVALFLEAGFDPSLVDSRGTPLLSLAVRAQFPRVAKLLIDAGSEVNKQSGDRGYTPLMDAVQKGDVAMVRLLLDNGAETDRRSKDGQTALIICAGRGDEDMAELLVAQGADPTIKDNLGMSATSYAKLFNNRKMMELFNTSPS